MIRAIRAWWRRRNRPPIVVGVVPGGPPVIGGFYNGLLNNMNPDYAMATGAIPAVRQANGLLLPALKAGPDDPTLRADIEAAWDAVYPPSTVKP